MTRRQVFTLAPATAVMMTAPAFASTSTDGRITITVQDVWAPQFPLGALVWVELVSPGAERVFVSINDGAPHDAIRVEYTRFFCLIPGGKADDIKKIEVAPVTLYLK